MRLKFSARADRVLGFFTFYMFLCLTIVSVVMTFYFMFSGDIENRNTSISSTIISMLLVVLIGRSRKDLQRDRLQGEESN